MIYAIVVLVSFFAIVNAGCDNACSGHGTCGANGICECYDNWGLGLGHYSGDCSQRTCPYEIAFVDSPYLESTYRKGYNHAQGKYFFPTAAPTFMPTEAPTTGAGIETSVPTIAPTIGLGTADDNNIEVGNYNPARNGGNTVGGEPYTSVARHKYAECSGRGLCNRDSGECECFPGYEGKGCQRTTCPNDCSGHGRCSYIEKMPYETTAMAGAPYSGDWSFLSQDALTFNYFGWDRHKIRGCICDPEYGDVDCSKRMCPFGTDIMDRRNNLDAAEQYEVQTIWLQARGSGENTGLLSSLAVVGAGARTFALTFKSKLNESFTTYPIVFPNEITGDHVHDFILDVEQALESLPNRVIDDVKVHAAFFKASAPGPSGAPLAAATDPDGIRINITFSGEHVQGPQNLLTVRAYQCGDGCTPKISGLALEPNSQSVRVGWVNKFGGTQVLQTGSFFDSMKNSETKWTGQTGANKDKIIEGGAGNQWIGHAMSDFNSYECGRRGKCDYSTGVCGCFAGYTGISCGTITALV